MRIFLLGFMGSGKSSVGRRLSRNMGLSFIDTDECFEKSYKITIEDFMKKYDQTLFRRLERKILKSTFSHENTIISTGGGTPCFFNNIDLINNNGLSVYIKMAPESLHHRLKESIKVRPLIKGLDDQNLLDFIKTTLIKREDFYARANIQIKGESINIDSLVQAIKTYEQIHS